MSLETTVAHAIDTAEKLGFQLCRTMIEGEIDRIIFEYKSMRNREEIRGPVAEGALFVLADLRRYVRSMQIEPAEPAE